MDRIEPKGEQATSGSIVAENVAALRALFPEAFGEGGIKFDVLKQLLGGPYDDGEERYGLSWHGKKRARQIALTPSLGTLRPCPEESVDWETTQNIVIEGDNLEVLKLLRKSYAGKVKLIYIDPPYNTGNDFVYPDDFADGVGNYLRITGQIGEDGGKITSNTESSGRFHTNWLNMMYPRLKVAKELLSPAGILLVSLNDVESPRLRMVLDEVFGRENFICQFVWNNEGNVDQQSKIKGVHEYVLCYARDAEQFPSPSVIDPNIEETSKLYNDQIENSITKNGPANPPSRVLLPVGFPAVFESGRIEPREDAWPRIHTPIVVRGSKLAATAELESGWSSRKLLDLFINNGCEPIRDSEGKETWFAMTSTGAIYGYKRRSESQGHVLSVIRNVGTTKKTSNTLREWGIDFPFPKPVFLVQYLTSVFAPAGGENHLVLDFFAGTGTAGEAVMRQNAVDQGTRRFVLVQLPAPNPGHPLHPTISRMTIARLRIASQKLREEQNLFRGDTGFRVFKLDTSNLKPWDPRPDDLPGAVTDWIENIRPGRTELDLLYELLLKLGLDLCVPIEQRTIAGKTVHNIGAGTLMVCLDKSITRADAEPLGLGLVQWAKQLAPAGGTQFVFRDSAFADDVAKTNLDAILRQNLPDDALAAVRSL